MKKIECVVRPTVLEELETKINDVATGMTVTYVKGCGTQKGETQLYRGATVQVNLLAKIKIEVVVPDDKAEEVVELLQQICRTGEIGDGKIFVLPVEETVRIRTGERGDQAL